MEDKPFKRAFSSLEQTFDAMTTDAVWSTSRKRDELAFLPDEERCVEITLEIRGTKNYVWKYGKQHSRVQPDFVVLDENELMFFQEKLKRAAEIGDWENPFGVVRPRNRIAIEILGDYTHSEKVIFVEKSEHERQLRNAYDSMGWRVYLIWEHELKRDEIPGDLLPYLRKDSALMSAYQPRTPKPHVFYLQDAARFREAKLSSEQKAEIVNNVVQSLREIDEPLLPFLFDARVDAAKLLNITANKNTEFHKPSKVGQIACRRFVPNVFKARLKTYPSLWEMWNDDTRLKEAVTRQLELFDGKQTLSKFKYELLHGQAYRTPSNFPPSTAFVVYREMGLKRGDKVLDPCAGFGGRLMGAWAAGVDYVAVEASRGTVEQLIQLSRFLNEISSNHTTMIIHGAIEDRSVADEIKRLGQFDAAFTSPPYFDIEHYSDDDEQSDVRYRTYSEWKEGFLEGLFGTVDSALKPGGKFALNVPERLSGNDFTAEVKRVAVTRGWSYDHGIRLSMKTRRGGVDEEILVFERRDDTASVPPGFGVKNSIKNYYMPEFEEGKHYVLCKICGERHARLSQHLRRTHSLSKNDYLTQFPGAMVQAEIDKDRVADENSLKQRKGSYKPRVAYRLPDGSVVRRKDAWLRAWNNEPPDDTLLKADDVAGELEKDEFTGGIDGVDFVTCEICGYRAKWLKQHVRKVHGEEVLRSYTGPLVSQKAQERANEAALKTWETRRRIIGGTGYKRQPSSSASAPGDVPDIVTE